MRAAKRIGGKLIAETWIARVTGGQQDRPPHSQARRGDSRAQQPEAARS
jgi:hypothetical protein